MDQTVASGMQTATAGQPDTHVQQVARASSGWGMVFLRVAARVLDTLILFLPIFLVVTSLGDWMFYQSTNPIFWSLLPALVLVLYHPFCEMRFGGSLGKRLVGIRVLNARGEYISAGQAALRLLASFFGAIFWWGDIVAVVAVVTNTYHQRVGDCWAKTYVVRLQDLHLQEGVVLVG